MVCLNISRRFWPNIFLKTNNCLGETLTALEMFRDGRQKGQRSHWERGERGERCERGLCLNIYILLLSLTWEPDYTHDSTLSSDSTNRRLSLQTTRLGVVTFLTYSHPALKTTNNRYLERYYYWDRETEGQCSSAAVQPSVERSLAALGWLRSECGAWQEEQQGVGRAWPGWLSASCRL